MGRKKEVEELQTWLADPNIKTIGIQGLGGIGKSSLAAYLYQNSSFVAKYWADVSQKPDFAAFAEKTIAALGGSVTQTGDTTQLINDLLKCLRQQRCLLVIDNLETLLNEAREFPDSAYQQLFSRWLQQGDTSTLLLTTQEQPKLLQAEKNWYPLAGMTPSDGAELLQKLEIQGTVEELADFAASVKGHPLTLQLVAGFLRQYCHSQLSGVAELGLQQFDLVYHQAEGVHRDKQDARLEWILEQHLQRLSQEQQNFLVNLSVYRQPFDFRAAGRMLTSPPTPLLQGEGSNSEAFSAKDEGQVVDNLAIVKALRELYNRSLLLETEIKGYYKFQPLVQEYLQKQGTDLSAAHEIAIDHYKSQVKPQPWETLEDVREYLEIFYHLCQLQRYGEAYKNLRICDNFLDLHGHNLIRAKLYEQLTEEWPQLIKHEDKSNLGWAWTFLGHSYNSLGRYQQAVDCYRKHLAIAQEISDNEGEIAALNHLSNSYSHLQDYQRAIEWCEKHLAFARKIGDRKGESRALGNMGNHYLALGQFQKAIDYHQQSLQILREIKDRVYEIIILNNLGNTYVRLKDYKKSIELFEQAVALAQEVREHPAEILALLGLGNCYFYLGQLDNSIKFRNQCLLVAKETGDRWGELSALGELGNCYFHLGNYQKAIELYEEHLRVAKEIGARRQECTALHKVGAAYFSLGKSDLAIKFLKESLEIAKEIGVVQIQAEVLNALHIALNRLGDIHHLLGQYQQANENYQQSNEYYQLSLGIREQLLQNNLKHN